jgi:hypothetical protein
VVDTLVVQTPMKWGFVRQLRQLKQMVFSMVVLLAVAVLMLPVHSVEAQYKVLHKIKNTTASGAIITRL